MQNHTDSILKPYTSRTQYIINTMNFSETYETPLRSYIQNRVETLENKLEEVARNRSNLDATRLEQQIDHESNKFINDVTNRLYQIRDQIKAHQPTDHQQPDYGIRMKQYQQFVESSSTGVDRVTNWIDSLLKKVISLLKNIIQWIIDNKQTIIDIIKQIRDAFIVIRSFC